VFADPLLHQQDPNVQNSEFDKDMNENSPASFLLLRFWLGYPQRAKEVPDLTEQSTHLTFEFGISIL
jgi:hypothetical protein